MTSPALTPGGLPSHHCQRPQSKHQGQVLDKGGLVWCPGSFTLYEVNEWSREPGQCSVSRFERLLVSAGVWGVFAGGGEGGLCLLAAHCEGPGGSESA